MFNKPSWNNRRGGYLKPPDKAEQERKQNLLIQMKETAASKKQDLLPEDPILGEPAKLSLTEIAQQEHFDLDSSIAEEVQKRVKLTQPKVKGKFNPIVIPLPENHNKKSVEQKTEEVLETTDCSPVQEFMNALQIVLKALDDAHAQALVLQDGVHQADLETSDLLHSIELTEFDENEKSDMTDKMKEVRIRRRLQKKHLEYVTEIDAYVSTNKQAIAALKTLKGKLNKIKEKHESALYRPRVRTDLKQTDKIQA